MRLRESGSGDSVWCLAVKLVLRTLRSDCLESVSLSVLEVLQDTVINCVKCHEGVKKYKIRYKLENINCLNLS